MPSAPPIHLATATPTSAGQADARTYAAFGGTALLAGANAVAVRINNAELAPFWGAAIRFLIAAAIFLVMVGVMRLALPRGRALAGAIVYGIFNFAVFYACLYWAVTEVSAGTAMIVLAVVPLLTLIFAVAAGVERFSVPSLVGAIVALVGVGVVFIDGLAGASPGALLAILGGAASAAAVPIMVKRFPRVHAVVANAVGMAVGGALLLALSFVAAEPKLLPMELRTQLALLYLILPGSIGLFLLFLFIIRRLSASASTYIVLLAPFVTIALDALILREPVRPVFLIGGAVVLAGVYFGVIRHSGRGAAG